MRECQVLRKEVSPFPCRGGIFAGALEGRLMLSVKNGDSVVWGRIGWRVRKQDVDGCRCGTGNLFGV